MTIIKEKTGIFIKKVIPYFSVFNILMALTLSIYACHGFNYFSEKNTKTTSKATTVDVHGNKKVTINDVSRIIEVNACNDNLTQCTASYLIQSSIDHDLTYQLETLLISISNNEKPNKPFCLLSGGGDASATLDITRLIRKYKATTCIASHYISSNNSEVTGTYKEGVDGNGIFCFSACGFILMSADTRLSIGTEGKVGVHRPARSIDFCWCKVKIPFYSVDIDDGSIEMLNTLINETPDVFHKERFKAYYKDSYNTEHSDIHILDSKQLIKYNVFNKTS